MSSRRPPIALATLILLGFLAPTARAHLGSTKYLHVAVHDAGDGGGGRAVRVDASLETVDVAMQLGLPEDATAALVLARAAEVQAWLSAGIVVREGGRPCAPLAEPAREEQRDQRSFVHVSLTYACAAADVPQGDGTGALVLRDDTVFPDDRQHEALVYLEGRGEGAAVLRTGHREVELSGPPQSALALARTFLWEGMLHFALGYDHILFLLSLLLGVGLGLGAGGGNGAEPRPRPRPPLRPLLTELTWLVTAFTVGHSVTLALAALELVVLPSRPIEIAIAASIVAVALHTARSPRSRRGLPLVAAGFGLIHGFGFSSVLREVGLPAGHTALALVAFNVGIELAQLVFVALVLGPLLYLGTRPYYERRVVRGGSLLIAAMAAYWVVERVLG